MFIELIVVCAVIMYLYTAQILDFSNPYGIIISIGIVVVLSSIGWAVTHYFARSFVDNLFGFGDWSPRGPKKTAPQQQARNDAMQARNVGAMESLSREIPGDTELSRRLADEYFRLGENDKFIAERLRMVETNNLTMEETCSTFNRLADIESARNRLAEAIRYLSCIVEKYPQAVEARHAEKRIAALAEQSDAVKEVENEE